MGYRLLADAVVLLHLTFVAFVVLGGVLVRRHRWVAWVHVPVFAWGALIEFAGWICPLTPLENAWRQRGGAAGYAGGFVEHYLLPLLYPAGLTRGVQIALGVLVLGFNTAIYGSVMLRRGGSLR
jgi:hypothetical protein